MLTDAQRRALIEAIRWARDDETTSQLRSILYGSAAPAEDAKAEIEHLDFENHRLRSAIFAMMKRLTDLLDEDQFAEMDSIALKAGLTPPAAPVEGWELIPLTAIASMLNEAIAQAVANGADSRSMPDDYVAIAHFVSYPERYALAAAPTMSEAMLDVIEAAKRVIGSGVVRDGKFAASVFAINQLSIAIDRAAAKDGGE